MGGLPTETAQCPWLYVHVMFVLQQYSSVVGGYTHLGACSGRQGFPELVCPTGECLSADNT